MQGAAIRPSLPSWRIMHKLYFRLEKLSVLLVGTGRQDAILQEGVHQADMAGDGMGFLVGPKSTLRR